MEADARSRAVRRLAFPLFVAVLVAAALTSQVGGSGPASAGSADGASAAESGPVARAAATSRTAKAVAAAKAFKSSLSSSQRSTLQFSFSSSSKTSGWSNLPTNLSRRVGIEVGDLSSSQRSRLSTLLRTILSSKGYADEEATRKADAYLADNGGGSGYGEGRYYVAFYGTPSTSRRWTVQFGGHHLAIHMSFSGSAISNTPYFVGVEPKAAFAQGGKSYAPMANEAAALYGAVNALSTAQKATAKLSGSFDDVLLGPGRDSASDYPTAAGVTVSSLSSSQQARVTQAIKAYLGDMPSSQAAAKLAAYKRQYAKTKLGYAGTPDGQTSGGYVRIQGPALWLEIATQNGIVIRNTTHYHSIERDRQRDYGVGAG